MRQSPILSALKTLALFAIVLFVGYVVVDAVDILRMQNARTEQAYNRLADSLDKLARATDNLSRRSVPVAGGPESSEGQNQRGGGDAGFVNDDLRDPAAEPGGSMITSSISLPGNLNEMITSDAGTTAIYGLVVDSLADRNNNDLTRFEPLMAESWTVSPDGLVYTIRLRDNIMWQAYTDPVTGKDVPAKQVTARDFLFYWTTMQNKDVPCEPIRTYYEMLDGIEVVDDLTFRVKWKEPYSMAESFTLGLKPLPEHYYRPDPSWSDAKFAQEFTASPRNQWIVGTGPYKLESWDKNKQVVLTRDEAYYGPKPPIEKRITRLVAEPTVAFLEFKRNELDLYGLQPVQWLEESPEPDFRLVTPDIETAPADSAAWDKLKGEGKTPENYKFEKYQYKGFSWAYIGYNMQRPLFRDKTVRRALTLLVDRERILDEVLLGLGQIISGPFVPQSPYYNQDVKPLPFDPAGAAKLLAEAGWDDTDGDGILDKDYDGSGKRKPFEFTFIIPSSSVLIRKWAAIVEQDFMKAKIKANIKPIEWSVYTQALDEKNFDVCSLLWTGGVEGDPYQIWHSSGINSKSSSNFISYRSEEADKLIEEGRRTIDKEKRYAIYRRLHEVIAEDQPYTFLFAPTATVAQNKRFRNVRVYEGGGMDTLLEWIPQSLRRAK